MPLELRTLARIALAALSLTARLAVAQCSVPTPTNCDGVCVDLTSNASYCGSCATACLTGQLCCNGKCTDQRSDPNNCWSCGTACSTGQVCCDGVCTSTGSDPNNCGTCAWACGTGATCCG